MQWGICILKPLSARPLFHLWISTLWLLSTREYLWWRCPSLSHFGSVARQMLAFESESLRDWHVPQGWRGEQIILTNMHEIHPLSDNLFHRRNFWACQTGHEYSFFYASLWWCFFIWLTSSELLNLKSFHFSVNSFLKNMTKASSIHLARWEKNNYSPLAQHPISTSQRGCWV